MRIEELIERSNEARKYKKDGYDFSRHIKMKYMPYSKKCALVKSIVDSTSYEEVNGKKYYKRDTANMLFVFTMQLIANYTDLEFDKDKVVQTYDALMESGVMNGLMTQIPEEEISLLRGMLDMHRDDVELNTRSLISFFETKADAIKIAMDSINHVLEKPEVQAKIEELVK